MNPADPFGLIGQVLDGQFRVDRFIGEGGFSIVYRGHHAGLNEPIAIKCLKLPPALGSALVESFIRRFRDESRIHYRLSQGNLAIARSIASGTTISSATSALVPYMVLEWLDGRSLAQDFEVRRQQGATGRSMDEVVKLLDPAAQGLAFAHAQGVVHRDMNPGNLFLAERQQSPQGVMTKVLDFGVAKVISDHALEMGPRAQTLGHIRIFAPAYGSPEQFDDAVGKVGPQSDVYSFALIVLEALRDLPVREGEHLGEFALMALDAGARPTPRSLGVPVGDAVEDVFRRAASLRPQDRPMDMGQFWGGLKHAIRADAESGKAPHADAAPSRPGNSWKRPPAAGQAPPDRPVTADMPAPVVEVVRPGSTAPAPLDPGRSYPFDPGRSHPLQGTVRMQGQHPLAPAPLGSPPLPPQGPPQAQLQGSGAAALGATPLTSTLMMDPRAHSPMPPPAAKPALNSTMAMPSPWARSQEVPFVPPSPPAASPPRPPPPATMVMNADQAFAAARAMAEAAANGASSPFAPRVMATGDDAGAIAPIGTASPLRSEVATQVPPAKSNGKTVALVVVALVLVAAGGGAAGYVLLGHSEVSPAPSAALPSASASAPLPVVPSAAASTPPSAAPAASAAEEAPAASAAAPEEETTASAAAPTPEPAPVPDQSAKRNPSIAAGAAGAGAAGAVASPSPAPSSRPAANPPSQPATASGGFDPKAARAALDVMDGVLASCRSPGGKTGDGKVNVTFNPDGRVDHAVVDQPPFAGTPEGACASSLFKRAKVAPFSGAPGSIVYTFHVPK